VAEGRRYRRSIEFGNMDGDPRLLTVIGVVGDLRDHTLESRPRPTIYVNYRQRLQAAHQLTVVRAPENPAAAISAARQYMISTRICRRDLARFRQFIRRRWVRGDSAWFSLAFFLGALPAVAGASVTSYGVAQRRNRREDGARRFRKRCSMILSQGLVTAGAGVIVGIAGALILTRWMQSLLFEVSPNDPMTFMFVAALLLLFVLVSCWFPARRATRVDPMIALRYE
jgi:hypothetical protein